MHLAVFARTENWDLTSWDTAGPCPAPHQGTECPQPQSSQLAFMARLLVSADLTADEIPATGGHRLFVPFRESCNYRYRMLKTDGYAN